MDEIFQREQFELDDVLKFIDDNKLIAVVRTSDAEDASAVAHAILAGGFKVIEISMNTPQAAKLIETLSKKENVFVGAGSISDGETAQRAVNAGAKFISCHFTDKAILTICKNNSTLVIQGAATPTEIMDAQEIGADLINLYPIDLIGGSLFLRRIRKLFTGPSRFVVCGGVNCENFMDYLRDGAMALEIGSSLSDKALIRAHNWQEITERAKKFQQKLETLRVAK